MLLYTLCVHKRKSAFVKTIKSSCNYTMRSVILNKASCMFFKWVIFNHSGSTEGTWNRRWGVALCLVGWSASFVHIYIFIFFRIPSGCIATTCTHLATGLLSSRTTSLRNIGNQLKNKNQLDATYYFIVLLMGSTCFWHYYARNMLSP